MIYSIGAIIICLVAKWGKLTHFQNPGYLTFDLEWLESYNTTLYGFSRVPSPKSGTVYRHVKQSKDIVSSIYDSDISHLQRHVKR